MSSPVSSQPPLCKAKEASPFGEPLFSFGRPPPDHPSSLNPVGLCFASPHESTLGGEERALCWVSVQHHAPWGCGLCLELYKSYTVQASRPIQGSA